MEDSFRVRVEKAFGSLPIPSSASLWSLSEDEINNKPKPKPEPEPETETYPTSSGLEPDLDNDLDEDEIPAPSKPSDYDDEQWQVKSGIGLDCTLDFEVPIHHSSLLSQTRCFYHLILLNSFDFLMLFNLNLAKLFYQLDDLNLIYCDKERN